MRPSAVRHVHPRRSGQRPRRRFIVLIAASAGALATLASCGGEKKLTRDNYNFPGAKKDETGNYQMRNAQ